MPIVDIRALRKSYGSNEVLKGIDLQVEPGEVIAIIGKSGSGKSTLLRCINGLEEFQAGELTVDGKPLLHKNAAAMRALRQRVGMIFQGFNLFPHLTVGKNIMLAPSLVKAKDTASGEAHARAHGRSHVAFCSVVRPDTHPLCPETYRTNDAFWTGRGYAKLPGVLAEFAWKDVVDAGESVKQLQFWMRGV